MSEEMKQGIRRLVEERNHVSFAELNRYIPGFTGDYGISSSVDPNVLYWAGLSQEAVEALRDLVAEKAFHYEPTGFLTYLIDGCTLKFPVARRIRKAGYKKEHWCPVVLVKGPKK